MRDEISTFTIGAYDRETGSFGVATASKFLAVGSVVPHAWADIGIVVTQSYGYAMHAELGRTLLKEGIKPDDCIARLIETDSERDIRQFALIGRDGDTAAYTGLKCTEWAGHIQENSVVCLGNMLTDKNVLNEMMKSYHESMHIPIWDRLLLAVKAGESAGGDKRGRQAAALLVVKEGGGFGGYSDKVVDLRADDSPVPLEELSRLLELWKSQYRK